MQYRSEWGRYARGCDAIIFVVDTSAVRLPIFILIPTKKITKKIIMSARANSECPS